MGLSRGRGRARWIGQYAQEDVTDTHVYVRAVACLDLDPTAVMQQWAVQFMGGLEAFPIHYIHTCIHTRAHTHTHSHKNATHAHALVHT